MSRATYPEPPFPEQRQAMPGETGRMNTIPDHEESTCKGYRQARAARRQYPGALRLRKGPNKEGRRRLVQCPELATLMNLNPVQPDFLLSL